MPRKSAPSTAPVRTSTRRSGGATTFLSLDLYSAGSFEKNVKFFDPDVNHNGVKLEPAETPAKPTAKPSSVLMTPASAPKRRASPIGNKQSASSAKRAKAPATTPTVAKKPPTSAKKQQQQTAKAPKSPKKPAPPSFDSSEEESDDDAPLVRRGRGRPPGSGKKAATASSQPPARGTSVGVGAARAKSVAPPTQKSVAVKKEAEEEAEDDKEKKQTDKPKATAAPVVAAAAAPAATDKPTSSSAATAAAAAAAPIDGGAVVARAVSKPLAWWEGDALHAKLGEVVVRAAPAGKVPEATQKQITDTLEELVGASAIAAASDPYKAHNILKEMLELVRHNTPFSQQQEQLKEQYAEQIRQYSERFATYQSSAEGRLTQQSAEIARLTAALQQCETRLQQMTIAHDQAVNTARSAIAALPSSSSSSSSMPTSSALLPVAAAAASSAVMRGGGAPSVSGGLFGNAPAVHNRFIDPHNLPQMPAGSTVGQSFLGGRAAELIHGFPNGQGMRDDMMASVQVTAATVPAYENGQVVHRTVRTRVERIAVPDNIDMSNIDELRALGFELVEMAPDGSTRPVDRIPGTGAPRIREMGEDEDEDDDEDDEDDDEEEEEEEGGQGIVEEAD